MQVTFDLVDYSRLENRDAHEILFDLFDDDDLAEEVFVMSGYDFGVSDSSRLNGHTQDLLVSAETEMSRLIVPSRMYDDLGLRVYPDEGYISSVSPRHVRSIMERAAPHELAVAVGGAEDVLEYLNRCLEMITYAAEHDLGLLIHMG